MIALLIITGIVGYATAVGASLALFWWLHPWGKYEGDGWWVASFLWPIALPAIGANALAKRTFRGVDERRAAAAKEADELRKRISELDEELRTAKGDAPDSWA